MLALKPRCQPLTAQEPSGQSCLRPNGELPVRRVPPQRRNVFDPTTRPEQSVTGEFLDEEMRIWKMGFEKSHKTTKI